MPRRIVHPRTWLVVLALAALALWIAVAFAVVPRLIESAFHGRSHPVFNSLIQRASPENTLDHYQGKWARIAWGGLGLAAGAAAAFVALRSRTFQQRCLAPATAYDLGMIRVIVCGLLLIDTFRQDLVSTAGLPPQILQPMGIITLLKSLGLGFEQWFKDAAFLGGLQAAACISTALAFLGIWTRATVPLAAVTYLLLGGIIREHAHLFHTFLVPLWLTAWLSFCPCGDAVSLDRWWRRLRSRPVVDPFLQAPVYTWSRFVVWALVAVPYLLTGLNKLITGGLYWWEPMNLKAVVLSAHPDALGDAYSPWSPGLAMMHAPAAVFGLLGFSTLIIEIGYPLVLVSRAARWFFPPAAALMHTGIFALQKLLFLDLIFLGAIFTNFTWLRSAIPRLPVPTTGAPETRQPGRPGWLFTTAASGMILLPLLAALGGIEKYPLTAWTLYSVKHTTPVAAGWKLWEITRSGARRRAEPGRYFGVLERNTYNDFVLYELRGHRHADYVTFLETYAAVHNAVAPRDDQIVRFELETWSWNFEQHPEGPQHAVREKLIPYDVQQLPTGG
jgi:hypothetical protein